MFQDFWNRAKGAWNTLSGNVQNNISQAIPVVQNALNYTRNFANPPAAPAPTTQSVNLNSGFNSGGLVPTANAQTMPDTSVTMGNLGLASPTNLPQKNFNIGTDTSNPLPSSSLNGNTSYQDVLTKLNQLQAQLVNGKAPANYTPSDQNLSSIISQIYGASQYSPGEQTALGNYNDTQGRILSTQLAARRQIQALQENGSITKEQAAGFITEAQRRSDAQLADLSTQQAGNTLSLQTLGMLRQNQLGALQNISGFFKPTEVSPGSSLMNAFGQQVGQPANGAAPATVLQSAMSLWQQAQASGTATYNSDGTPDLQPFLKQAQQYYGGGGLGTYGGGQAPQGQSQGGMPPQLATYLQASGGQIINEDKVPKAQQDTIKMLAAQNGVPYLTTGDLDKYQSINVTQENLKNMEQVSQKILSGGLGGRTIGALWNTISGALQLNPDVASFKAWRDTAVNTIQALAGGQGSGFRLNQAEINLAANNLPTITDNLETANAKMSIVNSMLDRWKSQLLTGNPTSITNTNNSQWNW